MQKITAILFSILLFMSGTHLAFGQHFCEGEVVKEGVMVGQKKMSCASLSVQDNCLEKIETKNKDCCVDVFHEIETDNDYQTSSFQFDINPQFFVAFTATFIIPLQELKSVKEVVFSEYLPPPLQVDVPVLFQTFLI